MSEQKRWDELRILLVDDDPDDYVLTRDLLDQIGPWEAHLEWADNFSAGLQRLMEERFDVCLLDYRLGPRTGLDFLKEIGDRHTGVPVIVLTGHGDREIDLKAMDAGAADYLPKEGLSADGIERVIRFAVERKRRRSAEARFRALIENSQDLITILDANGTIQYVSPSVRRLLGFDPDERTGVPAVPEVHPEDRERVEEALAGLRAEPASIRRLEYRVRHRDGSFRVLDTIATNLLDEPSVRGIVVNSRDITQRRQAQHEAKAARAYIELLQRVAVAANEARHLEEAIQIAVPEIAARLGWSVGHAFIVRRGHLEPTGIWHLDEPDRYQEFRRQTETLRLDPGEGLVGEAFTGGVPIWRTDVSQDRSFVRRGVAGGLGTALAIPVLEGSATVAILEFFDSGRHEPSPGIIELARNLGTQLGRVAERESAVRALQESHSLLNTLIEGVPDAIYIKDPEGRYLMINSAGAELLGRTTEEVIGHRDTELFEGPSAQAIIERDREVLEHGQGATLETTVTNRDGSTRDYLVTKGPIRAPDGTVLGLFGVSRDITEQKQAEEALRRSEEALRERSAALQERVKELNTLYSVSRILEQPHDSDIEDRLQQIVDLLPGGWQYPEITRARISLRGQEYATEGFEPTPWMQRRDIEVEGIPVGFLEVCYVEERPEKDEGPFIREERALLNALARSVGETLERRQLEEQFVQSQKLEAVGRLAGGIAHDFNNLLTAIGGHAELLLVDQTDDAHLREDLEEILLATQRASELTRQLLAFSRPSYSDPKVLDLSDAIRGYETMLRRLIGEDIQVLIELTSASLPVRIDESQLGQVVLNLSVNSRDAMPGGGRLSIRTCRKEVTMTQHLPTGDLKPGTYAALEVEDTGTGIGEEARQRLFEPFFTTKEKGKGTGLGLSLVYGVVREAGGHVRVISELQQGTSFEVLLPLTSEPGEPAQPELDRTPRGQSEKILVVEDEDVVRALLEKILVRNGYRVTTARDGLEALERFRNGDPNVDMVLSDVVMPRMGGVELMERLRESNGEIPVLLMTGYTEDELATRVGLDQEDRIIQKPFDPPDLLRKIRQVLGAVRAR